MAPWRVNLDEDSSQASGHAPRLSWRHEARAAEGRIIALGRGRIVVLANGPLRSVWNRRSGNRLRPTGGQLLRQVLASVPPEANPPPHRARPESRVCFPLPSLRFSYSAVTVLPLGLEPVCFSVPFVTAAVYVQLVCSQLNGLFAARTLVTERRRGRVRSIAGFGRSRVGGWSLLSLVRHRCTPLMSLRNCEEARLMTTPLSRSGACPPSEPSVGITAHQAWPRYRTTTSSRRFLPNAAEFRSRTGWHYWTCESLGPFCF